VVSGDHFGADVSISGDYAVAGAYGHSGYSGSAYVYQRTGSSWNVVAKLTASDQGDGDVFGVQVAIKDDYVIVGAPSKDSYSGAAYLFKKPESGWADMTETLKLTAPDPAAHDHFGGGVAIGSDYALISAAYDDNANGADAGSAFLFRISDSTWTQLTASDGVGGDHFGATVGINGNDAIVGADLKNGWIGAAYVYTVTEPSSVPEPSTLIIWSLLGGLGISMGWWRRKRAA
jgi:hypothetical protein